MGRQTNEEETDDGGAGSSALWPACQSQISPFRRFHLPSGCFRSSLVCRPISLPQFSDPAAGGARPRRLRGKKGSGSIEVTLINLKDNQHHEQQPAKRQARTPVLRVHRRRQPIPRLARQRLNLQDAALPAASGTARSPVESPTCGYSDYSGTRSCSTNRFSRWPPLPGRLRYVYTSPSRPERNT